MENVVTIHDDPTQRNPGFVLTPSATEITEILSACQDQGRMGLIVGNAGVGKTMTALHFCNEDPDHRFYLEIDQTTAALQGMMEAVLEALGGSAPAGCGPRALHKDILWLIQTSGGESSPLILVIDEAQHLETKAVEQLRSLHDQTDIAIVFLGFVGLMAKWQAKRDGRDSWAQLRRRIPRFAWRDINNGRAGVPPADIRAICRAWNITAKGAVEKLAKEAERGGLSDVTTILEASAALAGSEAVTAATIQTAIANIGKGC